MKKSPEGFNKNYSPEEIAKIEKERVLSDAELLEGGAEFIGGKGKEVLEPTPRQIEEKRKEMEMETKKSRIMSDARLLEGGAEYKIDEKGHRILVLTEKQKITEVERENVLKAVKQNGGALKDASPELQADKEVVLAAVKQNGGALQFASEKLRADKEVVLEALENNVNVIDIMDRSLLVDKEIQEVIKDKKYKGIYNGNRI